MQNPEDRLGRYRPSGPPLDLRDRIMSAVESRRFSTGHASTVREWLPAIGAAAAAIIFSVLASGIRTDVQLAAWAADDARETVISDLAQALGGDENAREEAERIVALDEMRSREADAIALRDSVLP